MRLRSIVEATPGESSIDAILASEADAILLTVADERAPAPQARSAALRALAAAAEAGKLAFVVVNHPRTRLLRDDLDALVGAALGGVFLAHTAEPQDVRDLAVLLREFELKRGIDPGQVAVFPVIATARAVLRAPEIAAAAPRVAGLVFHAEAYARDTGARHEEEGHRLAWARGAVVAAARADGGDPLIWPMPLDPRDSYQQGFSGAILRSPDDVVLANATYTPGARRLSQAREQLDAFEAARAEGAWVARHRGDVIDSHAAAMARRLLEDYGATGSAP